MLQFFLSSYSNQLPSWSWGFWPLLSWKTGSQSHAGKAGSIRVQNSNSKMVMRTRIQDDYYTNKHKLVQSKELQQDHKHNNKAIEDKHILRHL